MDKDNPIKIVRYGTLEELLAEFQGCPMDELDGATLTGYDGDGKEYSIPYSEAVGNIREMGCYGFARKAANEIHVWVSVDADGEDVAQMMGHEYGHFQRPYHRDDMREEMKADGYGDAADFAFRATMDLIAGGR